MSEFNNWKAPQHPKIRNDNVGFSRGGERVNTRPLPSGTPTDGAIVHDEPNVVIDTLNISQQPDTVESPHELRQSYAAEQEPDTIESPKQIGTPERPKQQADPTPTETKNSKKSTVQVATKPVSKPSKQIGDLKPVKQLGDTSVDRNAQWDENLDGKARGGTQNATKMQTAQCEMPQQMR